MIHDKLSIINGYKWRDKWVNLTPHSFDSLNYYPIFPSHTYTHDAAAVAAGDGGDGGDDDDDDE